MTQFAINHDGTRMVFYDKVYKHFIVTDTRGRMLHVLGRAGRGPTEFVQALNFAFDKDNNILIYDESQRQLKIFDPTGNLMQTANLFNTGDIYKSSRPMFVRASLIYFGIVEAKFHSTMLDPDQPNQVWKSKMVAAFDYRGNRKGLYGIYDPYAVESPSYSDNPVFYIDPEADKLYSTHANSYRIQIHDLDSDRRTHYFGRHSPHYKESEEEIKPSYSRAKIFELSLNQSFSIGMYATSNYIVHYISNMTKQWYDTRDQQAQQHYINVYNKETHNFNAEIKLPYTLGTVHKDQFYLIENNNPDNYTLGVYELQYNN